MKKSSSLRIWLSCLAVVAVGALGSGVLAMSGSSDGLVHARPAVSSGTAAKSPAPQDVAPIIARETESQLGLERGSLKNVRLSFLDAGGQTLNRAKANSARTVVMNADTPGKAKIRVLVTVQKVYAEGDQAAICAEGLKGSLYFACSTGLTPSGMGATTKVRSVYFGPNGSLFTVVKGDAAPSFLASAGSPPYFERLVKVIHSPTSSVVVSEFAKEDTGSAPVEQTFSIPADRLEALAADPALTFMSDDASND